MWIALFFVLWVGIGLGIPTIVHVLFASAISACSLAVVVGFVGGGLVSALLTGLLKNDQSF